MPKPFIQIACLCEKVLVEPDSVPSLIRVIDTYLVAVPAGTEEPDAKSAVLVTVFISLKSGELVGESEVGLRLNAPDSRETPPIRRWPVVFNGQEAGVNLKVDLVLPTPKFGLYWIDVVWGDEVLTRIPFRLKPMPMESKDDAVAPNKIALT